MARYPIGEGGGGLEPTTPHHNVCAGGGYDDKSFLCFLVHLSFMGCPNSEGDLLA